MIPDSLLSKKKIPLSYKGYINRTIEDYGAMTGAELSEKTHKEKPWLDAIGDANTPKNSNRIITHLKPMVPSTVWFT